MKDCIPDQTAREAGRQPEYSCAVTAPAGSGKTDLLTKRILSLLCVCEVPENILAITFTRKAAAEMRNRVISMLQQASKACDGTPAHEQEAQALAKRALEQDQRLGWHLAENPDRLQIMTIDSLSSMMAARYPVTSGFGGRLPPADLPEKLYLKAARACLKQPGSPAIADSIQFILQQHYGRSEVLVRALADLLSRRDNWALGLERIISQADSRDQLFNPVSSCLHDFVTLTLVRADHVLRPFQTELQTALSWCTTQPVKNKQLQPCVDSLAEAVMKWPAPEPDNHLFWRGMAALLLDNSGNIRNTRGVNAHLGFPVRGKPDDISRYRKLCFVRLLDKMRETPDVRAVLESLRTLPGSAVEDRDETRLAHLVNILMDARTHLKKIFLDEGCVDFIEINEKALAALEDDVGATDFALSLDYRIHHLLVDEFQDTSEPQMRLLEQITRVWAGDNSRSFFMVGDGMQSCYAFREANVGLFLKVRHEGISHIPVMALDLQMNFRSRKGLVDWINRIFSKAFPEKDDMALGAVAYSPATAFDARPGVPEPAALVCLHQSDDSAMGSSATRRAEARWVAEQIQLWLDDYPLENIGLLVKSRNLLHDILQAMTATGISWQATDIQRLGTLPAVMDLEMLTRAVIDPTDALAWCAVLRAPWLGLDQASLLEVRQLACDMDLPVFCAFQQWIDTSGPETVPDAAHWVSQQLEKTLHERHRSDIRIQIEALWKDLGGPHIHTTRVDALAVEAFMQTLEAWAQSGMPGLSNLRERLDSQFVPPDPEGDPRVQVMTLHKSKGLEFDRVIIPGLDHAGQGMGSRPMLRWRQVHARYRDFSAHGTIMIPARPAGDEPGATQTWIETEDRKAARLEQTRLLYVGCTRARRCLRLSAVMAEDSQPASGALLSSIWPCLGEHDKLFLNAVTTQEHCRSAPAILRLGFPWPLPEPARDLLNPGLNRFETDDPLNRPEFRPFESTPEILRGVLVHQLLDMAASNLPDIDSVDQWLSDCLPLLNHWFDEHNTPMCHRPAMQEWIAGQMANCLRDAQCRWLLSPHQDAHSEFEIITPSPHGEKKHIIDRTFVHAGQRWIVDFKTAAPPCPDMDVGTWLRLEVPKHRPQLQRYAHAMRLLGEQRPVSCVLYFTALTQLEKVAIKTFLE